MRTVGISRYAASISAAAALLAGCGGSQPPIGAPGAMPQTAALAVHTDRGESWMLPEGKGADLLYVSDGGTDDVLVFSYPQGALVGTLSGFDNPYGLCTDVKGDVFVVNESADTVVEYAHGGKTPIATLNLGTPTLACSVDEHTGDLAVVTPPDT
jgi:hypothetical protein